MSEECQHYRVLAAGRTVFGMVPTAHVCRGSAVVNTAVGLTKRSARKRAERLARRLNTEWSGNE